LWPLYGIWQAIVFLPGGFFFYVSIYLSSNFFSSTNLSRRRLDVFHTSTHDVALVRTYGAGLKRAARGSLKIQNAKSPNRHLGTIAQLCWAIFSYLRHVLTIGKNIKQQYRLHMSSQCGELQPTGWG